MYSNISRANSTVCTVLRYHLTTVVVIALFATLAHGQIVTTTTSTTDGRTPGALQPGSPAGSYPLSGIDNVNLYNGNLNFRLPLLNVGGRGSAAMSMTLALNLKSWHVKHTHKEMPDGNTIDSYVPTQTGWTPYSGYGAGRLTGRHYGLQTSSNMSCRWYSKTLSRLTFSTADGTEYELRDQDTNGQPLTSTCTQGAARGTVFITADGSAATFISDSAIYDNPAVNAFGPHGFSVSGYLMLRDGTQYRIDEGNVSWIRDRNGNKLKFDYFANSMIITDSLSRTVTVNYNVTDVAPFGLCDQIIYKGFGGAERILRVSYTNLGNALRPNSGYSIRTLGGPSGLFPELNGSSSTNHDPTVKSAVWLPDGRSYKFYYNSYGELARVELPTGGATEYDMTPGSGVICLWFCTPEDDRQIYRRVVERRIYPNGGFGSSFEHRDVYTNTESLGSTTSTVTVEQLGPTGTAFSRSRHLFDGSALDSLFGGDVAYAYGAWWEGNEKQTEILDTAGDITTATALRKTVTTRAQRAPISWWASHASTYGLDVNKEPPNDPRVTEIVSTIEPATTNLMSKQMFGYDDTVPFNNQNNVKEYDFGTGVVGSLLRETRTTFVTDPTYTGTNVHIRSLPLQVSNHDAGGTERARSTFEYDNYTKEGSDCEHSFHCLEARANVSGFCAVIVSPTSCDNSDPGGVVLRGNQTASTNYFLTNGSVIGSITAYTQYDDVVGNVIRTIDPRSTLANIIATTIEYDDQFGSPNGEARANTAPSELAGLATYAFPTKAINVLGHTTFTQFDYYLGQPVDLEDANGVVASGFYNDSLDRPRQMVRAANQGASVKSQVSFDYNDTTRTITTTTDHTTYADNLIKSEVVYDGLGRTTDNRTYETSNTYITVKTEYDALGRAYKTSNPFRAGESILWTTTIFDALSRVKTITTPDSAVVTTDYSGNTVTVTDQANKQRKSVSDALGRLKQVYEAPNDPNFNYQTSYDYDVLDNLIKVTQGSQQRFFMYDSLKRLIRARNPEQGTFSGLNLSDPLTGNNAWSIGYSYDVIGNLTQKTDARGVVSTFQYDALNRNTTVDYSDTSTINPDVSRFYDGATNGKGHFWHTYAGGSLSVGSNVEHTAIDSYDALGRPLVQRQLFKLNGTWGPTYQISSNYNLAGGVTSQTYPSGRTVTYSYDSAGRTSSFSGYLGDGTNRTYSTGVIYSPFGGISKEQFGTTIPIYNKLFYNSRGQLAEIREGTTYTGPTDGGWERGAIINHYSNGFGCWGAGCNAPDNNGNLRQQDHWINDGNGGVAGLFVQNYDYDALNRLLRVREGSWQQEYVYDRWGNRTIHQTNTYGTGIPKPNFGVDTATNRLTVPAGSTMSYDFAGNLTNDTYTGVGNREYDAENRMTKAWGGNNQWQYYSYDADGHRTRRKTDGTETWQIYGFDGELLAEYSANGGINNPQKEYGYRNGQLLITATAASGQQSAQNVSWTNATGVTVNGNNLTKSAAQGWGNAGATSTQSFAAGDGYVEVTASDPTAHRMIGLSNGDTNQDYTDIDFAAYLADGSLCVYEAGTVRGCFGSYSNGDTIRVAVENGTVKYKKNGGVIYTSAVAPTYPLMVDTALYTASCTINNVKISGNLSNGGGFVQWLVTDQLGTPRIILDQTGSLAGVKRHDYLPFGEELFAGVSGRSTAQGYGGADGIRQKFTSYERDGETGLDFAQARYHASALGRFTSADPANAGADLSDSQSWNGYSYVVNNPLRFIDSTGLWSIDASQRGSERKETRSQDELDYDQRLQNTRDVIAANSALQGGNYSRVSEVLDANQNVGLSVNGNVLWGAIGAEFSRAYGTPIEIAALQFPFPIDPQVIALKRGFAAVSKMMSKIRSPDFKIFNLSIGAGITRFIARGDDMSTALQGVSGGPAEAQVSFAVGWMLQRTKPNRDEIRSWGSGISFNSDFFFIGGGGVIFSPSNPKTAGVYVGVGAGGGVSGSFNYSVW